METPCCKALVKSTVAWHELRLAGFVWPHVYHVTSQSLRFVLNCTQPAIGPVGSIQTHYLHANVCHTKATRGTAKIAWPQPRSKKSHIHTR